MSIRLTLAVAAARTDPREIADFLAALSAAGLGSEDEVCIAASAAAGEDAEALRERVDAFPGASLTLHPETSTPMELWGFAMARARGSHVAVLEVRGLPAPDWARAWARTGRDRIVYGPVDPGALPGAWSFAFYLGEYGQFCTPLDPAHSDEVPGNNVVFPRELLPSSRDLEARGFWKTFHLQRLQASRGAPVPLEVAAAMAVTVARPLRCRDFLLRRFLHGRCYGGSRLVEPGAPPRLACLAFTPLLPALRTARVLRRTPLSTLPPGRLAAALPALVLGELAWSWGEFCGYARGAGDACERLW